jgi:hypothetical protein
MAEIIQHWIGAAFEGDEVQRGLEVVEFVCDLGTAPSESACTAVRVKRVTSRRPD